MKLKSGGALGRARLSDDCFRPVRDGHFRGRGFGAVGAVGDRAENVFSRNEFGFQILRRATAGGWERLKEFSILIKADLAELRFTRIGNGAQAPEVVLRGITD